MANSKARGKYGEYTCAEKLGTWWGEEFKRIPSSGALRWKGATFAYGDLLPPESFPAIVEAKIRYSTPYNLLQAADKGDIQYFWYNQLWGDVQRAYKETGRFFQPLLCYKVGRNALWTLGLDARVFNVLGDQLQKMPYAWCSYPDHYPFILVDLKTFFKQVTPSEFRKVFELNYLEA